MSPNRNPDSISNASQRRYYANVFRTLLISTYLLGGLLISVLVLRYAVCRAIFLGTFMLYQWISRDCTAEALSQGAILARRGRIGMLVLRWPTVDESVGLPSMNL